MSTTPPRIAPVASPAPARAAGPSATECPDLRCGCGNLLARRVAGGVELKCRRCKRTVVLPLEEGRND